ncbi:hypothetical protein [Oceanospirillum sediminis]|uniref:Uncharacterized protein n=1 Tax=Oceanospirillum sediminis TaxID=2760088 RepID=A0A839ITT6_9GAMM|nr:hypothetical protein [Oceanospirillum sediminis]MBB1487847.1 hypothetical protein [Oceanospirillum sediminis]
MIRLLQFPGILWLFGVLDSYSALAGNDAQQKNFHHTHIAVQEEYSRINAVEKQR